MTEFWLKISRKHYYVYINKKYNTYEDRDTYKTSGVQDHKYIITNSKDKNPFKLT